MHFSLLCDFALCTGVLLRPLGEISLLCSANLHTLASQTSTPFNLYNSNVEPPSVYWRGEGRAGLIYYSFEMENLTFVPQFLSLQPPPGNTLHILWTLDGVRLVEVEPSLQQVSCWNCCKKGSGDKLWNQCRPWCRVRKLTFQPFLESDGYLRRKVKWGTGI